MVYRSARPTAPWSRRLLPLGVFISLLFLYLASMPRGVVLEDDGYFIMAAYFAGVPHPPGYPLYTLIAHAATLVPLDTVAARVHAVSALFGALAAVMVYLVGVRIVGAPLAAASALLYGVSQGLWSQAIIAEVYTLNAFLFFAVLYLLLRYTGVPAPGDAHPARWLLAAALVFGLSLANHWPLMILSAPALAVLLLPHWRRVVPWLPVGLVLVLLGLLPYLWMMWRSQHGAGFIATGPIDSWQELISFVKRDMYASIDHQATATWEDKWAYARYSLELTARQVSVFALPLVLIGAVAQFRRLRPTLALVLTLSFLAHTVVLALLLGFEDEPTYRITFRVYPLIAFGIACLWAGLGARVLLDAVGRLHLSRWVRRLAGTTLVVAPVLTTLTANAVPGFRTTDRWAMDYAKAVLDNVPRGATLFVNGDMDSGPIGYLHLVEGARPDLHVYNLHGFGFAQRLLDPMHVTAAQGKEIVTRYVRGHDRPVRFTEVPDLPLGFIDQWLLTTPDPGATSHQRRIPDTLPAPLIAYYRGILRAPEPSDPWSSIHYRVLTANLVYTLCARVFYRRALSSVPASEEDVEDLALASRFFEGKLALLQCLHDNGGAAAGRLTPRLLEQAEAMIDQALTKEDISLLYYYKGVHLGHQGASGAAQEALRRSIAIYPVPGNPAHAELRRATSG